LQRNAADGLFTRLSSLTRGIFRYRTHSPQTQPYNPALKANKEEWPYAKTKLAMGKPVGQFNRLKMSHDLEEGEKIHDILH
jgi:hypothetical protein